GRRFWELQSKCSRMWWWAVQQASVESTPDPSFDGLIIGCGPGGYVTAIRAAQLGFKVGIIERDYLGGICLNWGCIPTKALLRSAEIFHYLQHAKNYGLSAENVTYDPTAVVNRSASV